MPGKVGGDFLNGWLGTDMEFEGEREWALPDDEEGESGLSRDLGLFPETEVVNDGRAVLVLGVEFVELDGREVYGGFGLSFPVGPLPNGDRLEGGRLRAWRYCSFSSSSSATRCSKA